MKKIYIYISLFAFAALTLGCSKEVDIQDELPSEAVNGGPGECITFALSVPESSETKTALGTKDGSSYPVKWSNGDQDRISLNGSAPTASSKDSDTQITASFKPTAGLAVYNFLYRGDAGHDNQVTIPASQTWYENDFDDAAMPMYAASATRSDAVTFNSLCSLLKFSLTGSKKIDSVTLTAADGTKSLSGTFTIGKTAAGLLNGILTPASGGGTINYNFGGHKQLSETPFVFYVAIPAGTYQGGITLEIVDNDSGHMTVTVMDSDGTKTIGAGKVREFDNVVYIPAKETNLKQIWNVATFQDFVSAVAGGNKTLNARLTQAAANLDLSSIAGSFASIEDYKGTFDGNGKSISGLTKPMFDNLQGVVKNLTLNSTISATATDNLNWGIFARQIVPSIEVDDAPGLQNCTTHEESSITFAPASALSGNCQVGGLVGNNRGGTISNCTNKATVTLAGSVACGENGSSTDKAQPSIGGVVGRTQKGGDLKTQGDISNCGNEGDVIYSGNWIANVYIGGVVGYQVEKAESISGCTNSGLVKAASSAVIGGSLHIGGVIGMGKGLIETCSNTADGEVVTEACSVQSYLNQGGVVGRINRGEDSYSGLSNAGTLEVAATGNDGSGNWIGGVVGRCSEGATLTGLTNSGSINCTATSNTNTFIGGITARITTSLSDSNSTGGAITYDGSSASGALYVGGVTAYTKEAVTISNCTSAMTINVGGSFSPSSDSFYGTGGIIGNLSNDNATISNCLNTGDVTWSQQIGGSTAYSFLGGVVGRAQGSISNSSNGGTVKFTGKNDAQNPYIGGIAGDTAEGRTITGKYDSASATNYGRVEISTSAQSKKWVYVGGIAGRGRATITATNAGQITITQLKCSRLYLGGIVGTNTVALGSGNANLTSGDITISNLNVSSDYLYVGGVTGLNTAAVTSATNAGDVVINSGSTCIKTFFVGGVVGRGEANITSCTNSGFVSNGCSATTADSYLQVGGVVGYNNGSSEVSSCHNTGNVSNSGNCNGYLYIGGITSEADALVSNCYNTGSVTNSGNSGNGKWIAIGGIAGTNSAAMTSSHNEGAVSNSGVPDEDINIGGVAGLNNGQTLTSCYNTGSVVNSGDSKTGYNVSVGGLVGWSSANSVYVTCYNEGDVENSGNGSNTSATAPGARVAGLIASASGANTISGDSDNYNYNNGEVYEHSASARAAVGGVCAWANNASTSLDYARNLSGGVIWVEDGEYTNVYVGGVLGVETDAASFNYTKNAGKIGISNITISKAAYIGGVHGGFTANGAQTITGCENTGEIDCPDSGGKSENMKSTSSASIVTYVGGVSSGAGNDGARTGKTFTNCINRGAITMYNQCWTRLGGVVGYANQNPSGCENHGKIVYYRKAGGYNSNSGAVGGVVGYINIATVSNLTNTGGVQTTGSSPNCYTGGIVGSGGTNMNKMTNCNVGKSGINIVGSGNAAQVAGLFASSESGSKAWTFTGCKVMSGTKCRGTEVTDANMETYVIGRGAVPSSITSPPVVVTSF